MKKKIKKVIEKYFELEITDYQYERDDYKYRTEFVREYNDLGLCMKAIEKNILIYEEFGTSRITTYEYDKRHNIINEEVCHLPSEISSTIYHNQYDKNGNLIKYDRTYTWKKFNNFIKKKCIGVKEFQYDNKNRLINSKLTENIDNFVEGKDNLNRSVIEVEIEKFDYDESGKLIRKYLSSEGVEYYHQFYFNDLGEKIEEVKDIKNNRQRGKTIISKKEKIMYEGNTDIINHKTLYIYDKDDNLIKKEKYDSLGLKKEKCYAYSLYDYYFID